MGRPGKPYVFDTNGSITFGKYNDKKCGRFDYYNTIDNKSWKVMADVQIGRQTLKDQVVTFTPGKATKIPRQIYEEYFGHFNDKTDKDIPDIKMITKSNSYTITKEDFVYYFDTLKRYILHLDYNINKPDYDFAFGSDFLQHYCISIRADNSFKQLQIGIAENFALK
ncbi:unnamed protein product [Bursaphelenchus okinawaensis]|uniref:Peptidase A1 domain-containing protein n=1 Tax=Bursaphelenchus okinawaensis TaxID=465554 RepID=A0A811L8J8_9BILA|nr:unnamed protein product [Bursaphelenchus okinawaensis]CAG9119026.1 unnamed protein product [Bursaphelenchus okinawaensis]